MDNQQPSPKIVTDKTISEGIDFSGITHTVVKDIKSFAEELPSGRKAVMEKHNISLDQYKKLTTKIYKKTSEKKPEGYVACEDNQNYMVNKEGTVRNVRTRREVKPIEDRKGYHKVDIGLKSHQAVHRLVAKAFIPNKDNKPQVNHKDGNKANNNVSNLEWCTNRENLDHAVENNLFKTEKNKIANTGSRNNMAKLDEEKVLEIRSKPMEKAEDLAKQYNASAQTIRDIRARRTWKHI